MPEPLSIAAGVTTLLSNSYKFSKDIYELIDTIKSAPKHIQNISDDLKALYATLGTLGSLLRDEQIIWNSLMMDLSANLEDALKNCVRVFREVGMVVNEYVGADGMANNGAWMKMKWTFKEKEVRALRDHLATYKATCMMAINTAT
jgi:Fungal N-terminal domain of STAND proteins